MSENPCPCSWARAASTSGRVAEKEGGIRAEPGRFGAASRLADDGRIDGDVFRLFLVSGVWRDNAERFLEAHKIDDIDIDADT